MTVNWTPRSDAAVSLSEFGLDGQDEGWFRRLCEAEGSPPLSQIGSYELLCEISRGGQGVVYRARQSGSERIVALKRLLHGPASDPISRLRFERELEAAAVARHAGIVKVLGTEFVQGQPLLAMEWVDGVTVTRWASNAEAGGRRSPQQIVELMHHICDALQHAHQRGVIHRDLKPSNILVDAENQPRILDFGLAKIVSCTENASTSAPLTLTHRELFVGTLQYASPEQLSGDASNADVRSDLYSLGLVFYEMLAGKPPYKASASASETLASIETQSPPRPSSSNAQVDRDLDAIVLKAIAREPQRRYQSVDALQADLARWKAGEPVLAQAPGSWYLLRKLIRRHRLLFLMIAATTLLVLIGAVVAAVVAARLAAAHDRERDARQVAEQTSRFLHEAIAAADPIQQSGPGLTVRELLDQAAQRLDAESIPQPQVRGALDDTIGQAYLNLGQFALAETHLTRGLAAREQSLGPVHADIAQSLTNLSALRYQQQQLEDAESLARRAISIRQSLQIGDDPDLALDLNNLGAILRAKGDLDGAQSLLTEALRMRKATLGDDHPDVAETLNNLGNVARLKGDFPRAEELCRKVLDIRRRRLHASHPLVAQSEENLAVVLAMQKQWAPAFELMADAIQAYRASLGPDHPTLAITSTNFGRMLTTQKRNDEALPYFRDALRINLASLPDDDKRIAASYLNLGSCLRRLNQYDEAERHLLEAHRRFQALGGDDAGSAVEAIVSLYQAWDKPELAEQYRLLLPAPKQPKK